jgi:hypothetical protein
MNESSPILKGEPPEPKDVRLIALFDALETGQLNFLDKASKRIIELCTAMLGLLFAVVAFGKEFPPAYIKGNEPAKWLAMAVLAAYVLALLFGVVAVWPRTYIRYEHDLTRMREELNHIAGYKRRWFRVAAVLFFAGSLGLAALVAVILWTA